VHEDPFEDEYPFVISHIDGQYVMCDKKLPFSGDEGARETCFSYVKGNPKLQYVEKALAVYLGGYDKLKPLGSNMQKLFQLLNLDQVDLFKVSKLRDSYDDLFKNYFLSQLMRHLYFIMPSKASRELSDLTRGL